MATIKEDITLRYQTTTDGDVEETNFSAGTEVEITQDWEDAPYYLIKDDEGHFYSAPKDKVDA